MNYTLAFKILMVESRFRTTINQQTNALFTILTDTEEFEFFFQRFNSNSAQKMRREKRKFIHFQSIYLFKFSIGNMGRDSPMKWKFSLGVLHIRFGSFFQQELNVRSWTSVSRGPMQWRPQVLIDDIHLLFVPMF